MRPRVRQDQVFQFIAGRPGVTTNEIGPALGITPRNAAAACTHLVDADRVQRKEVRRLASNRPVYAYWPKSPAAPENLIAHQSGVTRNVFSRESKPANLPVSIDAMLDDLALMCATRLVEKIRANIVAELQSLLPTTNLPAPNILNVEVDKSLVAYFVPPPAAPAAQPEPEKKRRHIGVVGLFPNQRVEIEKEFSESFKLSFWQNDDWDRLRAMAMFCEVVFVMARHVGHKTTEHLKSNRANTVIVEGAVSSLRVAMTEYYLSKAAA